MKLCFIADARSPTAKSWISHFVETGDEVSVISTYPCAHDAIPGANVFQLPLAFAGLSSVSHSGKLRGSSSSRFAKLVSELRVGKAANIGQSIRTYWGPVDVERKSALAREIIEALQPDLVHAMRLPYEGFLAATAVRNTPLLLSIWGTDLTLFAARYSRLRSLTRAALSRADALHCDCHRDLDLAMQYGFSAEKPRRVLPGGGGVRTELYSLGRPSPDLFQKYQIPPGAPLIINPRGFRQYVRNDVFFRSIPLVLAEAPNAIFLATGMEGNPIARQWLRKLSIDRSVRLIPTVTQQELASLFQLCDVSVSPSLHDGTPNSLLEAMTSGCFPVVGDLQSIREWIRDGENGFFCDAQSPKSMAAAIVRAIKDPALREAAAMTNRQLIRERAHYGTGMKAAREFYIEIISRKRSSFATAAETRGSQCAASLVS